MSDASKGFDFIGQMNTLGQPRFVRTRFLKNPPKLSEIFQNFPKLSEIFRNQPKFSEILPKPIFDQEFEKNCSTVIRFVSANNHFESSFFVLRTDFQHYLELEKFTMFLYPLHSINFQKILPFYFTLYPFSALKIN